jgi:hypothetical protein
VSPTCTDPIKAGQFKSHDLRQSRRLEKQGTAQSGLNWAPPKDGPQLGARPGGKELLTKNHEAASVPWTGRANPPNSRWKVLSWRRGDPPVARSARRILRNPVQASRRRASPADAFYPEAPYPRATTEASRDCQTFIVTPAEPGVYLRAINPDENPGPKTRRLCDSLHPYLHDQGIPFPWT